MYLYVFAFYREMGRSARLQDVHSLFNSEAGQEMERRMQNWAHHMSFLWIRRVRVHSDEY